MVFSKKLVDWYKVNKRDLPWRDISNAYRIWISEIILQQTKVSQGLPYYLKFIDTFPNVADLANANLDNVMKIWQGLGYYSRARNMHTTAKIIVNDYNETVFIEEALHRLVEIYYKVGLESEAKATAAILGYNYNTSEWYKESYRILNKDYKIKKVKKVKKKEDGLIKRTIQKLLKYEKKN